MTRKGGDFLEAKDRDIGMRIHDVEEEDKEDGGYNEMRLIYDTT